MIYPSARLLLAIAAGAPLALLIGVAVPSLWLLPLAWSLILVAAAGLDAFLGHRQSATARLDAPTAVDVGDAFNFAITLTGRIGLVTEAALSGDALLQLANGGRVGLGAVTVAKLSATALRRGTAHIEALDLRWQGPLGLVWLLRRTAIAREIIINPGLRSIRADGVALLDRDARTGMMAQLATGPGGEFEALTEYGPGMDRRRIDWKHSARHGALYAKEYRVERDNNIVLAFDCGRTMVEPIDGLSRLDRAITAGLLTAYVALKVSDRVTLFGFDARVRQLTAPQTGTASFVALKRAAAKLDYAGEEANFTLAMSTLAQRVDFC